MSETPSNFVHMDAKMPELTAPLVRHLTDFIGQRDVASGLATVGVLLLTYLIYTVSGCQYTRLQKGQTDH